MTNAKPAAGIPHSLAFLGIHGDLLLLKSNNLEAFDQAAQILGHFGEI